MKNPIYLGALLFALSFSAQATLIGDFVSGTSSGMTSFSGGTVEVTNFGSEFYGSVTGLSANEFNVDFDFGANTLIVYIEPVLSGVTDYVNFSVSFTDLDWVGLPTHVITGLALLGDDPIGDGSGLSAAIGDHSLALTFTNFVVPEFRELEIEFETAASTGGGPSTPIPEPMSIVLLCMGMAGLVGRRRVA